LVNSARAAKLRSGSGRCPFLQGEDRQLIGQVGRDIGFRTLGEEIAVVELDAGRTAQDPFGFWTSSARASMLVLSNTVPTSPPSNSVWV
jgi:hypothetical protein